MPSVAAGREKPNSKVKSMSVFQKRAGAARRSYQHIRPHRIGRKPRERIEAAIEAYLERAQVLILLLDRFDGDTDLEPSLGSQDLVWDHTDQTHWASGALTDIEQEHDGAELSSIETHGSGLRAGGATSDDDEPSLAHTNDLNQSVARRHTDFESLRSARGMSAWMYADQDWEAEHDGREPSLGARNPHFPTMRDRGLSQEHWAEGDNSIRADECEDRSDDDVCDTDIATAGCMAT